MKLKHLKIYCDRACRRHPQLSGQLKRIYREAVEAVSQGANESEECLNAVERMVNLIDSVGDTY